MARRYTYENDFEMLYLRHEYAVRLKNPQESWVYEFEPIVGQTSRIMYEKLKPNFNKVGFDLDDIKTITNMYMIYYMDIYSLRSNKEARQKIVDKFIKRYDREPTDEELARKDRNNLINFLKQRLQHCCTVCSRKARSITVGCDKRAAFAYTKDSVRASEELILSDYKKLGYRKVTQAELKKAKIESRIKNCSELIDKDGFKIIEIEMLNDGISEHDWLGLYVANKKDAYTRDPEEMVMEKEDSVLLDSYVKKFNNLGNKDKLKLLKNFISKRKDNKNYKSEVKKAREVIKQLKSMV
jgi:hypothetical protein